MHLEKFWKIYNFLRPNSQEQKWQKITIKIPRQKSEKEAGDEIEASQGQYLGTDLMGHQRSKDK